MSYASRLETPDQKGRSMRLTMLAAILSAMMTQTAWSSQFTIDGSPEALTLVAEGAPRAEVVAALAERFDMEVVGGSIANGIVDGRYSGSLGQVLKLILPANGYALAYRHGKPARVTFTGVGGTEIANGTGIPALPPAQTAAPAPSADAPEVKTPTLEERLQREASAQIAAPAPSSQGDAATDQEQMKQMTDQTVQQLQELVRSIREIQPK